MNEPAEIRITSESNEPAPDTQTIQPLESWAHTPTGTKVPAPHYVSGPFSENRAVRRIRLRNTFRKGMSRSADIEALESIRASIQSKLDENGVYR